MHGFIGIASELISYDNKIDNVVSGLLGGTVIVEKLIDAIQMSKASGYAFKIVSLDGDVINPQGSITGGSKKSEAVGLMSREREIDTLKKEIVSLKTFLPMLGKVLKQYSQQEEKYLTELKMVLLKRLLQL